MPITISRNSRYNKLLDRVTEGLRRARKGEEAWEETSRAARAEWIRYERAKSQGAREALEWVLKQRGWPRDLANQTEAKRARRGRRKPK